MLTRHIKMRLLGIAALGLGCFGPGMWAKTWTVGKPNTGCPNPDYNTISAAVNAAGSGDTIEVCPALYAEQLLIAKPLILRGLSEQGIGRVLIQPALMIPLGGLQAVAVITVMNTAGVTIQNFAVDAGDNSTTGCTVAVSGIHFYNSSGTVDNDAVSGARLSNPLSCPTLFPGNGFGVQIDQDPNSTASFRVSVWNTSIRDFTRNGILVVGSGETADIEDNSITGVGPSLGVNQFGVFLATGARGLVARNIITLGTCGAISISDCINLRSEGVVLRSAGEGVIIDGNTISNVQAGIFVNGAANARVTGNTIGNVDALSAIHIQGSTSGMVLGNRIFHVGPFTADTASDEEGCGINDVSGTGSSANIIEANWINDAYCGVAYVSGDRLQLNVYQNTLFESLNGDNYPDSFPAPAEPAQAAPARSQGQGLGRLLRDQQ